MAKSNLYFELNLLPSEYGGGKRYRWIRGEQVLIGALSLLLLFFIFYLSYEDMNNRIEELEYNISIINAQIEANKDINIKIKKLKEKKAKIMKKINALKQIDIDRAKWVKLLELFEKYLPDNTWLTLLKQEKTDLKKIRVEGFTYSFDAIAQYITELNSDTLVSDVKLNTVLQTKYRKEDVYKFVLYVILKQKKLGQLDGTKLGNTQTAKSN